MGLPDPDKPITYSDYLREERSNPFEVLDGKIIGMSPSPTPRHQHILGGLYAELRAFLKGKASSVFIAPIDVCLFARPEQSGQDIKDWVQPDLVVVCDPNKIGDKRIVGCPDFVVEVLSPATAKNDRVLKYNAYAKAGVKQYWIVDPYHEFIETFTGRDGSFERSGQYFKADVIADSPFDHFRLDLKELFGEMI